MKKTFTFFLLSFSCLFLNAQNRGLHFDGSNDYVEAPFHANNTNFGAAITMEAWINTTNANLANQTILNRGTNDSYSLYLTSNKLSCIIGMAGFVQTAYTFNNSWHHVAAVYNGSNIQLYIDGNPAGAPAPMTGNVVVDNGYKLILGMYPPTISSKFNGIMEEVRIWNTARTQAQIQASMNKELYTSENPNLRVYYRFNQGTAAGNNAGLTTLTDAVGGSNGTLFNFALSGTTSNWVGGKPSLTMLPLNLVSFTATKQTSGVVLRWKNADQSVAQYEVERSKDGAIFQAIGALDAGARTEHQFTDEEKAAGTVYYRLKAISVNGKTEYSAVIAVVAGKASSGVNVYPNPASDRIWVSLQNKGRFSLIVRDLAGRAMQTKEVSNESGVTVITLDLSGYKKGAYFVCVDGDTKMIIKE